jgi:uroporphyrinogen decarboxylase
MTAREIIRRCVHFQKPPRVGRFCGRFGQNDIVNVFDFFQKDENGFDPWGIQWSNAKEESVTTIGIPKTPPLRNESEFGRLKAPDAKLMAARTMENIAKLSGDDRDKYRVVFTSSGIWERSQYFRGMEELMCDMLENPSFAHRIVQFCADFWVAYIEALAPVRGEIDAIYMFEDWGTQADVMIGPPQWREFFGPQYRRIVNAAHANKMDFWLHSCGKVTRLIGDFIEVGMDLVNPYQSAACGYEEVASNYAGKIAFLTTVDTQTTLKNGTKEQILSECKRLEKWGTAAGGFILATYGFDVPEENEKTVLNYFNARPTA